MPSLRVVSSTIMLVFRGFVLKKKSFMSIFVSSRYSFCLHFRFFVTLTNASLELIKVSIHIL
jgi:hypothetical protein